jgi:hypothetical protein
MGNGCSLLRGRVSKLDFLFYVFVVYLTVLLIAPAVASMEF